MARKGVGLKECGKCHTLFTGHHDCFTKESRVQALKRIKKEREPRNPWLTIQKRINERVVK
jgi:hypothetical protein